jgi:hypothetical protein
VITLTFTRYVLTVEVSELDPRGFFCEQV